MKKIKNFKSFLSSTSSIFKIVNMTSVGDHPCFSEVKLNLSKIKMRLLHELKWSEYKADFVIKEYRRFLYLICSHPIDLRLIPSKLVQKVWDNHILQTSLYAQHCEIIIGRFIHNQPSSEIADGNGDLDFYTTTIHKYKIVFGDDPNPDVWPADFKECNTICCFNQCLHCNTLCKITDSSNKKRAQTSIPEENLKGSLREVSKKTKRFSQPSQRFNYDAAKVGITSPLSPSPPHSSIHVDNLSEVKATSKGDALYQSRCEILAINNPCFLPDPRYAYYPDDTSTTDCDVNPRSDANGSTYKESLNDRTFDPLNSWNFGI